MWFKWLFWESRFIISPFYLLIPPLLMPDVYLETYFKYSGLILRLIGFILIIIGINKKLENFTGRGVERIFIEWWNKRPGQNKETNSSAKMGSSVNLHGHASVSRNFEGATVEEKLNFLLDFVEKLDDKITKLDKKVLRKEKEIISKIKEVEKGIKNELKEIRNNIEIGFIGNINLEVLGALSIMLGIVFSSIPMQLISFFS